MHTADATDESLMRAWQQGDAAAFEEIYRRHRGPVYRFVRRQCGGSASADDVFQEVWMTFIRQRNSWEPRAALRTFLYRIAHSRTVDQLRVQSRERGAIALSLDEEDAPEPVDACRCGEPEDVAAQRSDARALERCLAELPAAQREAFLLKEEAGMGLPEMSETLAVDAEALKSRVRYAIRRLRECLTRVLGESALAEIVS
ncbi:MAG: sigma-70 family RNA polymerase sigma factor [Gammaproteobacteria bacterium]